MRAFQGKSGRRLMYLLPLGGHVIDSLLRSFVRSRWRWWSRRDDCDKFGGAARVYGGNGHTRCGDDQWGQVEGIGWTRLDRVVSSTKTAKGTASFIPAPDSHQHDVRWIKSGLRVVEVHLSGLLWSTRSRARGDVVGCHQGLRDWRHILWRRPWRGLLGWGWLWPFRGPSEDEPSWKW